jgi:hypothetical protein
MDRYDVVCGTFIVTASAGTTPGPASGITYSGIYQDSEGNRFEVSNLVPTCDRPPDTIDTRAAPAGSTWPAAMIGGVLSVTIVEREDYGNCT